MKAILTVPGVLREINPTALEDYLTFGMVQGERSILRSVKRLAPGTVAVIRQDGLRTTHERYWSLRSRPDPRWTEGDAIDAIRAKVTETVQTHMVADVPIGAFLSGGMDSGIVVSAAGKIANHPLRTFTMGFSEHGFNESAEARRAAHTFGTEHHEEMVTADSMALVDELVRYFDEPFADTSAVPTYLVSKLAARHVKVVLSGDGGDEAFGGYNRYRDDLREWRVRTRLPATFRRHVIAPIAAAWPKVDWLPRHLRAKTFLTNVGSSGGIAYANSLTICREPGRRRLLSPDLRSSLNGHHPSALIAASYDRIGDANPVAAMIAADIDVHLPDDYLTKVDRASMAHGLEVRPVFADHELLELTATLPSHFKVRGSTTKWLLRKMYADLLPPGTTVREKRGFAVPVDLWLRGPLRGMFHDSVLGSRGSLDGLMDVSAVRLLFDRHVSGVGQHGDSLWSILMLARWCDAYLAARPEFTSRSASLVRQLT